jgi:hypothetical protein
MPFIDGRLEGRSSMNKRAIVALGVAALAAAVFTSVTSAVGTPRSSSNASTGSAHGPVLKPAHFVDIIDNPYYPLPVGRTLIYRGVRDGVTQVDRVTVTARTKVILGITATVVRDVATHGTRTLEATTDWFAQDRDGNVWYLGEDTKAYDADGTVDTSGSWQAGVDGAQPGIIMEANPQIPDGYRQEFLRGEAEDTAWVIDRGRSLSVPYGTVHHVLRTLEFARIEPGVVDQKYYAPGLGIVLEQSLAGDKEVSKLVRVVH